MLEDKSCGAVIADGRIHHEENLLPWEGEEVRVTARFRVREVAPLDEFDIELDVYDKMPVATAVVGSSGIRDVGSAKPSPVLPEGIGHD